MPAHNIVYNNLDCKFSGYREFDTKNIHVSVALLIINNSFIKFRGFANCSMLTKVQ